ncbi:MAG: hypothetical protein KBC74_02425 [Candidatus Pacebacteria bacterium]|nr:hypothetical protein [Candidatus Paceibacterota bacterium]MBP9832356.1 hypothetical protein [Candidatus Paceibacterota bacterium]
MAEGSKSNIFSIFGGKKRIPRDSYKSYLAWAIAVDAALFWLPGAGDFFILYCRGMWWLNGYNTDKMMAETLLNAAGELLPFVPCSTSFVFISYRINKANTEPLAGEESEGKSRTEEAEGKAIRALQGKNPGTQDGGAPTQGSPEKSGGTPKTTGGTEGNRDAEHLVNKDSGRPQSQSLKETPNKSTPTSNKSVDGVNPQKKNEPVQKPAYQPTQPAFRRPPANDNAPTEAPESEELPDADIEEPEQTDTPNNDGGEFFDNARRVA